MVAGTARVEKENLYQILGVRKRATAKEIKSAYRRKALETHPDKRAKDVPEEQAAADFQRVVHAYEVLSNKDDRNAYDRTGQTSTHQGNFQFHFHRPPRRQPQQRQGNNNSLAWTSSKYKKHKVESCM
ncbi:protein DnaJ [Seminavis robusta]|uniref:Protein DnaJ n=1 Tax=Seminavis robusta TaxID=568900 RepID=A0A9N8EDW5_9STRA|nr:protein DnaJ [Seminavis robusta]|eukprot:Sro1010_g230840.1 protein DnaJ (128) ;mRNA; r:12542-13152